MFGAKKIADLQKEHLKEINNLLAEKLVLQNQIQLLEEELSTCKSAEDTSKVNNDMFNLALNSYGDGMVFLQSSIDENLFNLSEINALNKKTVERIDDLSGQTTVISSSIENIQKYTSGLNDNSTSLNDSVTSINNIINLIKGISDQTNLLALNAAIEAARAGEHGRGFAVVSDEVRQLAQHTQNATQEVEVNIASLQKNSVSITEISKVFSAESSSIIGVLDSFKASLADVSSYSQNITGKTFHVTNATSVSIGKIDHICLKIDGYNAFTKQDDVTVVDHNSCRFGKWFNQVSTTILADKRNEVSLITEEHKNVHTGLQSAIAVFSDKTQDNSKGVEIMKSVEGSSKKSFELLLNIVKSAS